MRLSALEFDRVLTLVIIRNHLISLNCSSSYRREILEPMFKDFQLIKIVLDKILFKFENIASIG